MADLPASPDPHKQPPEEAVDALSVIGRRQEIDRLQHRTETLLNELGYEGLLLTAPENFAWFTCGGDSRLGSLGEVGGAALYLTAGNRVVLCHSKGTEPLFRGPLRSQGFQLKERSSLSGLDELLDEVCRGRRVASDTGFGRTRSLGPAIDQLRREPTEFFRQVLEQRARQLTDCIEPICRSAEPGISIGELRGRFAQSLYVAGHTPLQIEVRDIADATQAQGQNHSRHPAHPLREGFSVEIAVRNMGIAIPIVRTVLFPGAAARQTDLVQTAESYLNEAISLTAAGVDWAEIWSRWKRHLRTVPPPADLQPRLLARQIGFRWPENDCAADFDGAVEASRVYFWDLELGSIHIGQLQWIGTPDHAGTHTRG